LKLTVRSSAIRTKQEIMASMGSFSGKIQDNLTKVNSLETLQKDFSRKFQVHQRDI